MDVLDTIAAATPPRRTVEVVLDGALEDEWLSLNARLIEAADKDVRSAQEGEPDQPFTTPLVERMEEIRDQVEASRVLFVFERVEWLERVNLQADHPPRDGNRLDALVGYNISTYTPAIIRRACVGARKPGEDDLTPLPAEAWDSLLGRAAEGDRAAVRGSLSYGQVDRLYSAAVVVNDTVTKVPMSARSLLVSQDSGASSTQPSPGTSPRSGSKAGSRPTSRSSRTTRKAVSSG